MSKKPRTPKALIELMLNGEVGAVLGNDAEHSLSRSSYRIVIFALVCLLSAAAAFVYLSQELDRKISVTEDAPLFVVNEGDGIIRVLQALEQQGYIRQCINI